jgi:LmbE family N-acetylglucosaminyl deacetylase
MKLTRASAEIYAPDGGQPRSALSRVTHMCIAAHQDDVEIMALDGILACFGQGDQGFMAVVVTDGAGSARDSLYAHYTDEQMRAVRRREQKKAAYVGEYAAVALLDHPSSAIKDPANPDPRADLKALIAEAQPKVIYTHNLADKHDTHVSVALRTIAAIRDLPAPQRPRRLYGCEVWRDLDWMMDSDKVVFRLDQHESLAAALVGVFDSQIVGGKRYDLATIGRRRAHATYHESHSVDASQMINFGMDLTPLVVDDSLDIRDFVQEHLRRFADDVNAKLTKFS